MRMSNLFWIIALIAAFGHFWLPLHLDAFATVFAIMALSYKIEEEN